MTYPGFKEISKPRSAPPPALRKRSIGSKGGLKEDGGIPKPESLPETLNPKAETLNPKTRGGRCRFSSDHSDIASTSKQLWLLQA